MQDPVKKNHGIPPGLFGGGGGGAVTSVGATAPITSTGGANPNIGITNFVASGGSHARGAVPDPGAVAGTSKFLREDATWATPVGGVTSVTASDPLASSGGATPNITIADFIASGASHDRGAVPDPGASAGSTKFLCENATWAVPPGTTPATTISWDETPSGTIDGVNDTFTLAHTPVHPILLFVSSLGKAWATIDYNVSGATITFVAGHLPVTGDLISATYQY